MEALQLEILLGCWSEISRIKHRHVEPMECLLFTKNLGTSNRLLDHAVEFDKEAD